MIVNVVSIIFCVLNNYIIGSELEKKSSYIISLLNNSVVICFIHNFFYSILSVV